MPRFSKYLLLALLGSANALAEENRAEPAPSIGAHFSVRQSSSARDTVSRDPKNDSVGGPSSAPRWGEEGNGFTSRQASYEQNGPVEKPAPKLLSVSSRNSEKKLPLAKPGEPVGERSIGGSTSAVLGSLGIVLGLFLLVAWMLRRAMPRASQNLPTGLVEVLGRAPLTARQHAHLIRCGNKMLLVAISPAGMETLTEITDPVEVDRIAGICQQSRSTSTTAAFRKVFSDLAAEPAGGGFVGDYQKSSRTTDLISTTRKRGATEGYHV